MDETQKPVDVINVLTPSGELVGLASHDVDYALQSGYQMAGPEHIVKAQQAAAPQQMSMSGAAPGQAEAFAASPMAVEVTKGVEAMGRPYTAEGLAESHNAAVERMRTMQQALKSGDFKAASAPAVEMAMSAGMGLLNAVGPKGPKAPLPEATVAASAAKALSKEEAALAAAAGKLRAGKPSQLTGIGEEIVVDDAGEPIAKLINGNMVKEGAAEMLPAAMPKAPKPKKPAKPTLDEMPDRESPFFHKSEEIVNEKMGASATPEQIRGMLKEVKPEEAEWLGLEDFLKGKGKVSKQELMDHIAGNRLELKEVVKGSYNDLADIEKKISDLDDLPNSARTPEWEAERDSLIAERKATQKGTSKFSDYQLPGGENYREVLFTMPEKARSAETPAEQAKRLFGADSFYDLTPAQQEKIVQLQESQVPKETYRSSHWDEPNVLAHTRVNDRTIDGKKTLFIEEIQSDWHQAGRKQGYKGGTGVKPLTEAEKATLTRIDFERIKAADSGKSLPKEKEDLYQELSSRWKDEIQDPDKVPNAPLKKTWHENVFKRMVREAAEKGYDQVAWTTGATQAERYSLGKHVNELHYDPELQHLIANKRDTTGYSRIFDQKVSPDKLQDYVGKEAAEKLLSQPVNKKGLQSLRDADLQMGGEGMKGFYDKILPEYANKFGKKFGAKVEKKKFWDKHEDRHEAHVMKITPEMKKAAMKQGFSMFAMGGMAGGPMGADLKENYSGKKKRKGINYVGYADGGEVELPSMEQIDQDFAAAQAAPSPFASPLQSNINTQMPEVSANVVNVLTPTGELVGLPHDQVGEALAQGYRAATDLDVLRHLETQKYGTVGQQVLTGVEGAAEGLLGPIATGAEEGLSQLGVPGISATDRMGRQRTNPFISGASEFAGFVGPAIASMGSSAALKGAAKLSQAGLIASAEKGAAKALGLESASGFVKQIGEPAVKGAFGAALYQGGQEISEAFNRDPNQTAQTAIADIGLAGVLGGVFGGAFGAAAAKLNRPTQDIGKFVSEVDRPALEAGNFSTIVKHSDLISDAEKESILSSLTKTKKNSKEITAAAERLGAPVLEGIISDSALIQKAEDSLINGAATYSGIKRNALYKDAFNTASGAVDGALGEGSKLSKAELGAQLKQSISGRLREESAPIEQMYQKIKNHSEVITADEGAIKGAVNDLLTMKELTLSPKSPEGQLIKRAAEEMVNLKTVDDLKQYKSILSRSISPTASSGEKRMIGIIGGKLAQLEEESVLKFAKGIGLNDVQFAAEVASLVEQRKLANVQYKNFIKDVQQLSEQLGKGRVYGVQDALHFINERLTPEEVATRLFSKKDSEFLKFFANKFPQEMQLVKNYQKQVLREEASTQGVFSPLKLFNKLNKLEPEIKAQLFDKQELSRLADAELYLRNFPKRFNPSGTSELNAFREFMKSPYGAIVGNARDAGIEAFIKFSALSPEMANASSLGQSTVKGWNAVSKASKALFDPTKEALPSNVISIAAKRDSLKRLVDTYSQDPVKFMDMNDNNPVPEYSAAFSMTGLKAVEYLNSIKPVAEKPGLLNQEMPITQAQKAAYDRQVALAQQPLLIYGHLKNGTLVPQDMTTLKTIYPDLYNKMSNDIFASLAEAQAKKKTIPYSLKMSLSVFLGQPLDASMTPDGIMSAQPALVGQGPQGAPVEGAKVTQSGGRALSKMANTYETPLQSRAQRAQK